MLSHINSENTYLNLWIGKICTFFFSSVENLSTSFIRNAHNSICSEWKFSLWKFLKKQFLCSNGQWQGIFAGLLRNYSGVKFRKKTKKFIKNLKTAFLREEQVIKIRLSSWCGKATLVGQLSLSPNVFPLAT